MDLKYLDNVKQLRAALDAQRDQSKPMELDSKLNPAQLLQQKRLTIVMDITGSYDGWKDRTCKAAPEIVKPYEVFRFVGMNDNCGGACNCTCAICTASIRVEPWRSKVKDLQADFEKHACSGGFDTPEKPACVLRLLAREYEEHRMAHGQRHDIVMFFDSVGHGVSNATSDNYKGGCPDPKKCGCNGDVVAQALLLKKFGARVCIIAPNSCLDDPLYAVYTAAISKITGGWVAALPDEQDLDQFAALKMLGADHSQASEMFRKAHEQSDPELVQEFNTDKQILDRAILAAKDSRDQKVLDGLAAQMEAFEQKYILSMMPGLVQVENFGPEQLRFLINVSACVTAGCLVNAKAFNHAELAFMRTACFWQQLLCIDVLKAAMLQVAGKTEVAVFTPVESKPVNAPVPVQATGATVTDHHESTRDRVRARYLKRTRRGDIAPAPPADAEPSVVVVMAVDPKPAKTIFGKVVAMIFGA